jgi:hypothetical protein
MATNDLAVQQTLAELIKRSSGNQLLPLANVLARINPIFKQAVWGEANNQSYHIHNQVVTLPSGSWRRINEGTSGTAGTSKQISEPVSLFESLNIIDEWLADISGDPLTYRANEDNLFVEGMTQGFARGIFYANHATNPAQFDGIVNRSDYNLLACPNVWNAGGSSNLMSIYMIEWGLDKCFLAYPAGSETAGIQKIDKGKLPKLDQNYNTFFAYYTQFKVNAGFIIRDPRCVQRVANIATSGSSNLADPELMIKALKAMPDLGAAAEIYVNRTASAQMDIQAMNKQNGFYEGKDIFGTPVSMFRGHPVYLMEVVGSPTGVAGVYETQVS